MAVQGFPLSANYRTSQGRLFKKVYCIEQTNINIPSAKYVEQDRVEWNSIGIH